MRITAAVVAGVLLAIVPATAQAPSTPLRTADGKPNLNGIWQAMNEANWDIQAHTAAPGPVTALGGAYAVPPGLGVVAELLRADRRRVRRPRDPLPVAPHSERQRRPGRVAGGATAGDDHGLSAGRL